MRGSSGRGGGSGGRGRGFFSSNSGSTSITSKYGGHSIYQSTSRGSFSSRTARYGSYGSSSSQSRFASFATSPYTGYGYYGGGSRMYFFYGYHSPYHSQPRRFGNDICTSRVPSRGLTVKKEGTWNNDTTIDDLEAAEEQRPTDPPTYFDKLMQLREEENRKWQEEKKSCDSGYSCDEDNLDCDWTEAGKAFTAFLDEYLLHISLIGFACVMFCCMYYTGDCECEGCEDEARSNSTEENVPMNINP